MLRIETGGIITLRSIFFALLVGLVAAGGALAQDTPAAGDDPSATADTAETVVDADAPPASPEAALAESDAPVPKVADAQTKSKLESDPRFTPPPPTLDATTHDLLLLNSGEWLQGDIKSIRDDTIEFDSVELEDIDIDLGDVKEIHANRVHTYRFEGRRDILTGPARANADIFVIGGQERPRSSFMQQVPGKPTELNFWNGDLSVGYSISSGNTNQSDLTIRAELNRETALTRFTNVYVATVSTADDDAGQNQKTANSHRLNSAFDYYVSNRLYLIVPAFEVFADEFQNINLRLTPSAGLGFEWLKRKRITWDLSTSAGVTYTDRVAVAAPDPKSSTDAVIIFGTDIETDPTDDVEWDTTYTVQVVPAEIGLTNHHLESIMSIDLFWNLDLDITFIWDRIEDPAPLLVDAGPPEVFQPVEKNDYRLTFGIGWDF